MVAEKADTRRSGSGATGNDHFACYYPKAHGSDIRVILKELRQSLVGAYHDEKLSLRFLEESIHMVDRWAGMGHQHEALRRRLRIHGSRLSRPSAHLAQYDGHNQKQVLTRQAKKEGVEIVNHMPVVDLIKIDGEIAGALALDVSKDVPSFTVIRAKKVVLSTGTANRLYPAAGSPGWPFNTAFCPACTGAAQAQGWRIGAKMVNMEMPNRHAGPKFFARAGKSTWIGVYRYPNGKLLGPFVDRATRYVGDITCDVWNSAYTDVLLNGSGPAYIDLHPDQARRPRLHARGHDQRRTYHAGGLHGPHRPRRFQARRGIHAVRAHIIGRGLEIDIDGQTSVPGLYAAGDMVGNFRADIAGAAVYGWIAGGHAGASAASCELKNAETSPWVAERAQLYSSFMEREAARPGRKPTSPCSRSWIPTPLRVRIVCVRPRCSPPA